MLFWISMYILHVLISYKLFCISWALSFDIKDKDRIFFLIISLMPVIGISVGLIFLIFGLLENDETRGKIGKSFKKLFYFPAKMIKFLWSIVREFLKVIENIPPNPNNDI